MNIKFLKTHAQRLARAAAVLVVAAAMSPHMASAQLYPKAAPPGSTFVRVFNGTAVSGLEAYIGPNRQTSLLPYAGDPFTFLPPGQVRVSIGTHAETYTFEADHFYSVVETSDGLKLFDMRGFQSQLKAMVVMFNLMRDTTLSLKTADGKAAIFDGIGPYKGSQREVNPVTVPLALFSGDQKLADIPSQPFERGKVSSLVVAGTPASPIVSWGDGQ